MFDADPVLICTERLLTMERTDLLVSCDTWVFTSCDLRTGISAPDASDYVLIITC